MDVMRLFLASASPRRRDLLQGIGLAPEVVPVATHEAVLPGEAPERLVQRLAEAKGRAAVAAIGRPHPPGVVLAADTAVVVGDRVLGKPASDAEAGSMLRELRARAHRVLTGVWLGRTDRDAASGGVDTTCVHFRDYDDRLIAAYVASGEPRDKAGAYGIQGRGALLARGIEGSWSNVVGLPLERLPDWLAEIDLTLEARGDRLEV